MNNIVWRVDWKREGMPVMEWSRNLKSKEEADSWVEQLKRTQVRGVITINVLDKKDLDY
jgi:hypothetical protein